MKKVLVILFLVCCAGAAFAQKGAGRVLENFARTERQITRKVAQQQQIWFVGRQARLAKELAHHSLVPLKILRVGYSVPTAFALPFNNVNHKNTFIAQLPPKGYDDDKYPVANIELDEYIKQLRKAENTEFLYRGMHLTDLGKVQYILSNGLEVNKADENRIYLSPAPLVAKLYAETSVPIEMVEEIPVLLLVEKDKVMNYLTPERALGTYYSRANIPAEAISHLFAFLDINGKPAWYRVVLQDEMIFIPLPDGQGLNTRLIP